MPRQFTFCAVVATLAMGGLPLAQAANSTSHISNTLAPARAQNAVAIQASATRLTQGMLTDIVAWLSANFDLPAIYDHPRIELVSPARMNAVRFSGRVSGQSPGSTVEVGQIARRRPDRDVEALYDDASRTIYLPEGWTGTTPAERSVLVHEMVHHLQNVAGLKYECAQAREKTAYVAQDKWLVLFGRNLMEEFKLDAMTVLVRTKCIY